MVNINNVYQSVLVITNKDNRGYITPDEFNRLAEQAQNEIFASYFAREAGYELNAFLTSDFSDPNTYLAEKNVEDKLIFHEDVVIGIAASGNTPFTCTVLEKAKNHKALTIAISNNHNGDILKYGDHKIILDTKAEVIAGSTRLKAGTAQKICLNVISSMVMVKMGRVKNGMMNEMVPTNEKLRLRKKKLINLIN